MQRPDIIFFTCQMKYPGRNFFAVRRSNWWSYLKDTSLFPPQRQVGWPVPRTIVRGEHCQQAFLLLEFSTFNICFQSTQKEAFPLVNYEGVVDSLNKFTNNGNFKIVTYECVFIKAVGLQCLDNPSNALIDCAHLQIHPDSIRLYLSNKFNWSIIVPTFKDINCT